MAYELPPLPYAYDALEPTIDEQTMHLHHDKHHQTYVNNLNAAIEKHPELGSKSPEELLKDLNGIPEDIRTAVRNNGGGHVNHTMFWEIMAPGGSPGADRRAGRGHHRQVRQPGRLKQQFNANGAPASAAAGPGWSRARRAN